MKISELKPGDLITQQHNSQSIAFEVIAIQAMGHHFMVTFRSVLGDASARYHGEACIG